MSNSNRFPRAWLLALAGLGVGLPSSAVAATGSLTLPAGPGWVVAALLVVVLGLILVGVLLRNRWLREASRLEASKHELETILDSIDACIYVKAADFRYQYVNRKASEVIGRPVEEILGKRDQDLFDSNRLADQRFNDQRVLEQGEKVVAEEGHAGLDGTTTHTYLSIKLPLHDPDGSVRALCSISTDVTEFGDIEASKYHLTFYDPLTGLPNRRLLLDRLAMVVKGTRRSERYAALMFIDLDDFKVINETQGLQSGDRLLRSVAQGLQQVVRESDTLARLGADEFVMLIHDLGLDVDQAAAAAERVAEKLLGQVMNIQPADDNLLGLPTTASIGITLFADGGANVDSAMRQADIALQQAKAAGGNTLRFFNPEMQADVMERVHLEADLHQALARNELRLHYQIQVDERSRVTGVEALIRWEHPQRGLVPPNLFIPQAEKNRLILPIGYWVLETACRQLAAWAIESGKESFSIAVNVSSVQFHQADFVARVQHTLESTRANPARLVLEVTESLLMEDPERVREIMLRLSQLGIRFALDDFGTGFSSLNYLKRLPLHGLKIDKSFVNGVLENPVDAAIVNTTLTLADSLGLKVTAEGVETEAQHRWLLEHGCKAFQGYLFGRPLPLEELKLSELDCTSPF
ncbi:putative bifunctional diguanylate cyclase/phosphodiesterase [Billgrantia kenyensis]|uniref:cyclic-guanylate-specific phosphodiesterase n=1 Tax=Billgrantia kenyensis TaxID=321266 RepID=A0A7W0AF35_9GAMM|nr:GGDEF domain-containing phosphodiesterase [Halomonas kenyensis]MBA2780204.1 EAL domain-containing protein [Halomonas kenyensis]MCG6663140.1 EAL domain-containing protein [Halomonas kenyensis]